MLLNFFTWTACQAGESMWMFRKMTIAWHGHLFTVMVLGGSTKNNAYSIERNNPGRNDILWLQWIKFVILI